MGLLINETTEELYHVRGSDKEVNNYHKAA